MKRNEFIKTCGLACLGATSFGLLMQSCVGTKTISSKIEKGAMLVPVSAFVKEKNSGKQFLDYLILQNEKLQYPIYVFRFSVNDYSALYLRCTHQGNELNAYGEKLVCSAHGSKFDNRGNVANGPANLPLTSFPTQIISEHIEISLKSLR